MQPHEAQSALASVHSAEARLANKVGHCPPWRHAAFGALFALLIGSIAISSTVQFAAMPVIIAGVVLLIRWDRKRYGVFINGYRRGRTLPVTLGFVGIMIVLVVAAMHMRVNGFTDASKIGLAALAFAIAIGFSLAWGRTFMRELAGSAR